MHGSFHFLATNSSFNGYSDLFLKYKTGIVKKLSLMVDYLPNLLFATA